ncbi:MAG: hypothetical protein V4773_16285 [Verrucomicrobiota bacterium]
MSRSRRILYTLAALLVAAGALVEHRYLAPQRAALTQLEAESARLAAALRRARLQLSATERGLRDLEQEAEAARAATAAAEAGSAMKLWAGRIALLKRLFDEMPGQSLPELRLLAPLDWIQIVRTRELDSPEAIRTAMAAARAVGRRKFGEALQEAVQRYAAQSGGELPSDISQLAAYLTPPTDLEMLQRYSLLRTGRLDASDEALFRETALSDLIMTVWAKSLDFVNNPDWSAVPNEGSAATMARVLSALEAGIQGYGPSDSSKEFLKLTTFREMLEHLGPMMKEFFPADIGDEMKNAAQRFVAERSGAAPASFADLIPYFPKMEEAIARARPILATLEYMREHDGQRPTDPAQLARYLAKPVNQIRLFHDMKLTLNGDKVSMKFSVSDDIPETKSP